MAGTRYSVVVLEPAGIDAAERRVAFAEVVRGTFADRAQADVLVTLLRQLAGDPPARVVTEGDR